MSDIDKFLDEPVSDTPATTSAVDSFMEDAPDTAKGFGGALRDTAVAAGSGAVTGAQLLANAAGADNAVAQKLGDAADYVRGFETEARREERAARAAKIKAAEESGSTWEEIKANVGAFTEAPIDTTLEALGTSLPSIAATALTRGRGRVVAGSGMGAAQGAGAVKGSSYDAVEQEYLQAGATPEEAAARAAEAQAYSGDNSGQIALGAGLGAVAGSTGIEGAVGRMLGREAGEQAAQGVVRSTLTGAAKEAPIEATQGGQERLASNLALQNEGFDTPTWQGVAGQAALEGVAGAAAGGGFGAVEGALARDPQSAPAVDPTEPASEDPANEPAPTAGPTVEPQAPTAEPQAAGMAPPQVPQQYRTERPYPAKPSEQMGLDPSAGPLSDAAATAVDSGASAQLAQQAAEQQAAEQEQKDAKKGAKAGEQIDTATGEITQAAGDLLAGDSAAELQDRLNFVKQAARANGWDARLVAERDRLQAELDKLQPQTKAKEAAKQVLDAGGTEADANRAATDSLIDSMAQSPDISIATEAPAAVASAKREMPPTSVQEGIAQAKARRAQEKPADQAAVSPETVTAPSAAEASTQPADQMAVKDESRAVEPSTTVEPVADQTTGDIKAVIAKQIPQMTDAEIEQAIAYYGPDNKRTAKLQKEQAKRATQGTENVPQTAETVEASPQPAQVAGQAPADSAQATGAADAGSAAGVDPAARWEAMSRDERQALAEKSGVKSVFAKSLPGAPWGRIGEATQRKLVEAMTTEAPQPAAQASIEGRDIGEQWNEMPPVRRRELMAQPGSPFTDAKGRLKAEAALLGSYPWDKQEASDQSAIEALLSGAATQQAASADQATVSPETVTAPATAEAASDSTTSPSEQVESKQADEYAARLRELASGFPGTYMGRPMAPLASDIADHAIKNNRRLTDGEIQELGLKHDIPVDVVEQLVGQPFAYDGIKGDAERGNPGAKALRAKKAAPADQATVSPETVTATAAPEAETKAKDRPKYGESNKLVSQARREEIRALMRKKALNLNSGVDPELMALGAELAVFHIEAGTRKFADFAKAMIEDIGEKFTPFLRSFYDAARSYPGLDTEGMTPYEETIKQHTAMLTPAVREAAAEVVGTVAEKPKARTKKTGAKGDMVLTQDWGVPHIDGYGDSTRETGNDTKDAFLKEARNYLNATADALRAFGYEPHLDRKGKPEKPVSVNESGPAVSGDVSLVMRNEDSGNNVYITIGDTSLRGMVPSTPSGIAIMYRVGPGTDRYASKAGNTWAPVDLSANDLAALVYSRVRPAQENEVRNEQPTDGAQDQGRAQEVRGRGRDPQPGAASADSGDVASRQPANGGQAGEAGDSGRPGVRQSGTDVASGEGVPQGRDASDGRARAGRAGSSDAGARADRADGTTDATGSRGSDTAASPVTSPAATAAQARDLHIETPLDIVGGTPVQRFNRNRAALELLQTLQEEGRQANADEQKVLAGYIGWGSFGQELFQGTWERPVYKDEGVWKERGEWLRNTLGESAWKSAQRSITNAHYTDPPTVMAMWDMVRRMGFQGGKVLEPSMGTGNFYSMMPADLKARSQLTGIELDETTGEIAKQLFPQSNVRVMGYQDSKTPDGFYDLIIGNWPFENTPVADRRYNKLNPMLHDYFFLKTMDQVRPGGIVIGITSAGSMDKQNTTIRRELAKQAELVASIRLPSGAFEEYAGTKVVTDIVILRKRPQRLVAVPADATWVETGEYQTPSGQAVKVNRYYLDNPQNIIGTLDYGHGTTTFRAGMIVHRPDDMVARLKQAVELVPQGAMQPSATTDHITYYANETGERHGALAVVNGKLMVAMGDQLVEASEKSKYALKDAKKTAEREQQLVAAVDLRKRHTALVDAERAGQDGDTPRKALSNAYKAFTKAHGPLRESFALSYLERIEDPFYAELAALENDDGTPAAVMQRSTTRGKRTIENPSVRDAYVLARNQSVNPSLADVARISGKAEQAVKAELLDSGAVFEAPNGDIVPSDIYLSGNVRQKMREAEAALAMGNKAMSVNIQALKDVMPEDVPYFNIETKLGATWVPNESYKQFVAHMLARESTDGIDVSFRSGRWKVKVDSALNNSREAQANYGTPYVTFGRLVQAAMSNQVLRLTSKDSDGNDVYDSEKTEEANARIAKMREDFGTWLWSDPERRQDLEHEYNEARNAWATPKYDGSFLTFEGMALTLGKGEFNLRQHQVNAIWRAIVNRRSLNAHEVGTGKTFTMGGIAIESRRYGIAKKPVILAHNANSATVAAEIRMMYPAARVLYVDNLQPQNREIRLRQIANDDWDAIVIPHSLIDRLALREETLMQMAADDIAALEAEFYDAAAEDGVDVSKVDLDDDESVAKVRSVTAKELAKARKRIIENIKKQAQQSSKEGAVTFEDLGIDMILVDEVHEFKKPPIVTRMQMKGLNTQVSGRSIALQFLTRYVRQMNNGGNVHTFTGTPITNTITEIYHQMRYVMESEMDTANVADWDGWFGSFATEVQDVELSAAGDYEMVTRLAGFVNVPELRQMVGQYMDTVFADDMPEMQPRKVNGKQMSDELTEAERAQLLNGRTEGAMDRPYKKVVNASADMTERQQQVFRQLQQYAQDWRNASGKERREMMRSGDPRSPIVTEGIATKASFDVRLLDESLAGMEGQTNDDPNSKASRVVANTLDIFNSDPNANQVIFAEMGFSKSVRRTRTNPETGDKTTTTHKVFSTIHDIVERLVQGGIPREQIAVVDGSTSKERRKEIAQAMNESRMRVVIGSTDTLGVGVNMQRNLRAMHHLDAPYMPGELEQRNGRGQRQGNQWNTVMEFRYMTDRLDGRRWQILAVKQRFINAFMKANNSSRVIEGEAAADEQSDILESFSEAAGDPRVLQRVKMQKKLESLQRKERMYTQGIADMRRQARNSASRAEQLTGRLNELEKKGTLKNIESLISSQRESFTAVIDGKTYDKRADAIAALADYVEAEMRVGSESRQVGTYAGHPIKMVWLGFADSPTTTIEAFGEKVEGKGIAGAEAKLRGFASRVQEVVDERDSAEATARNMRAAMDQPFNQAADIERVAKQLADLEKDLEVNPVPPPAWLRQGAPIDSEVFRSKKPYIVTGHRYSKDGWFVVAEDDKGATLIPYMEATDNVGMPMYEEREFVAPTVEAKKAAEQAAPSGDAPLFSRRPVNVARGATPVLSHDAVKAIVERVNSRLNLGTQLAVYRSEAELFAAAPEIERQAENDQAKGQINAVYHNGKVHVVTSAFVFEADVEGAILEALAHEGQGHYGIRALFRGDRQAIDTALREFFAAIGGVAGVRRLAAKNDIDLSLYLNTAASMGERQRAGYLADELLAHLQGKAATASLTQRAAAAAKAYLGAIREWLRNHGFTNLAKGTDADIALLLKRMRDASTLAASSAKGAPRFSLRPLQTKSEAFRRWFGDSKVVDADGKPLNLYHGTAADFTVFDQSRAGSATGHATSALGIFMSSDRRAAQNYAEKASDGMPGYGRVMDLYASIQNPYLMSVEESQDVESPLEARRLRTRLEQQGYDGIRLKGTPVWIAFNNYQVKSATDNVGTFDEFDPDIRFSRSAVRDMASNAANAIASVSVQDVKRSALGKWTDFLSLGLQSLGRRQLVDLYDGMLPMRKYAKLVERMDADKNDTGAAADELARRWGKLKDSGKLADLMHEATLAQTDADPLVPESKAVNPGRRDALIKQFEQLSPEAQAIYREARDAYKAHHRNVIEAIKERVKRSEMGSERKAELLRKMDSEFYKAIQGVYFPLARFGSYVVAVNGPDGKIASVHRAETMGEANALREQLQQKFPRDSGYDVGKVTLDKEFVASRDSVSRGFMSELYGALDGMKLPSSQLAELEDTLGQLYLASMPDLSWAKHGIHRKGTAGFSDDARRAFAQNLFHGARYLAKLRYGDRMQDELDRMQKYADARKQDADYDQPKAQRVIDEMVKRHESMMNPKSNPLSTALTSFGFIYYLGLSPAAAVVNLTQTALVAYPVMGAKWGFNKSAAALMKASNEAVRGKNDITKSLSPEELKAFEKAVRDGTIDVTQAHDLAGIAQGEDSKVMWKIRPVMRMASYMFHQAEVFNRQVTFVASYRLAREAGASTTTAYEQAKKATYDGHFDYSASNRPRLMQGNVAKVVLLFKQYAQNMLYTLTRNTYQAFAGESPAVRKEARKTIGAILALHAAAAGVLGLPLVGPLLAMASAVGGDDDEPWDAEVALRNLLADALGPKASEVIARGLSRLGPADISGRVSLNNLLLPDVQEGLEGKKLAEAWTSAMLGPVAGIFTNAAVGANHIAEGRYAMGLESMLPVALRNPLKSLRYADEGVVDRSGVVVRDEVGIAGIASQLVGFSPSEVRLSFEGKSAIFDADRRLSNRRSELMTQFARAAMEGDQGGMAEAREAIAAFNQKNPSRRIQANHLMQSVQARRRRIAQAEDGVYLPRNRADAREAGRFANPE